MDVTSLLNTSSGANTGTDIHRQSESPVASERSSSVASTEHRSGEGEKSHKSRRPWNADGYSLPLSIDVKAPLHLKSRFRSPSERLDSPISSSAESGGSAHSRTASVDSSVDAAQSNVATPSPQPFQYESRTSVPGDYRPRHEPLALERQLSDRPRHKFSDSHSSLSSYGSSVSGSHSRISSVTTVSGMTFENTLLESKLAQLPESLEVPTLGTIQPPSPRYPELHQNAEYGFTGSLNSVNRLLSPTDILSQSRYKADSYFVPSKFHKRTVSAPNCAPAALSSRLTSKQSYPVLPPPFSILDHSRKQEIPDMSREQSPVVGANGMDYAELCRRGSMLRHETDSEAGENGRPHPRRHSSLSSFSETSRSLSLDPSRSMSQGPAPIPEDVSTSVDMAMNAEACCMFVENCNTGSQLRKAISHLFGRNKNCTQRIPKHVWVYYCRKHYQRVRYRNAKTYPLTQMELVKVQIHRLQAWSAKNQSEGQGSFIDSWDFSLRKREQKRLNDKTGHNSGSGHGDDSEDENASGQGGTNIPGWIVQHLGNGLTTEKILGIVDRLYSDLEQGLLTQVPEVEFLPNIVEKGNESSKPGKGRRHNSTASNGPKTPKRKASDVSMSLEQATSGHHMYYSQHEDQMPGQISPSEKRIRVDQPSGVSPQRIPGSFLRPLENLPSRPAPSSRYAHSAEHALPRAPHVVPKMHFGQGYYGAGPEGDRSPNHQMRYAFNGHGAPDEQGRAYFYELSSVYGHMPTPPDSAHEAATPQFSLPSMAVSAGAYQEGQRRPYRSSSLAPNGYGSRPTHQRSASAFTLADRHVASYERPSSSGLDGPGGHHSFDTNASAMSRYGMDAPRNPHGSHGPRQHGHSQSLSLSHSPFPHGGNQHAVMHGPGYHLVSPDMRGRR